ncbi:hypothetical protein [Pelagibacterium lentulum]|uniref:hypothetical protein n=1 Tax=Pelagibacterium lentulum TaxID=2029865 RepID=UPI000F8C4805|nr:hypothetical protein [Pelagibacterium lentulum]
MVEKWLKKHWQSQQVAQQQGGTKKNSKTSAHVHHQAWYGHDAFRLQAALLVRRWQSFRHDRPSQKELKRHLALDWLAAQKL